MSHSRIPVPPFSRAFLPAGTKLGIAVSGGADSVALLRLAQELAGREGWTVRVLHVDHGLRGAASRADAEWVEALAGKLGLPYAMLQGDLSGLDSGLEEAGRLLRYGWFKKLLLGGELHAVATGHTLDDQAETVLGRLLRGAWTAGLGGIHPVMRAVDLPGKPGSGSGIVLRPLLEACRTELRAWLKEAGQGWREDETNKDPRFTRNRIRGELLPALVHFNPKATEQLAQISVMAREDEAFWQAEVDRLLPGLVLPGRAVRGGGRASSTVPGERSIAFEVDRVRALAPALRRRLLRAAAAQLGATLEFGETARVLALMEGPVGSTARREQLTAKLRVERTPRELRFVLEPGKRSSPEEAAEIPVAVPGEIAGFGVRLRVGWSAAHTSGEMQPEAILRAARPGDRVRLRYSSGAPKRVKEVLERLGIATHDRAGWPVLEWQGEIVWLRGAVLEATPLSQQLTVTEESLPPTTP